jgi:hypothetical protein
VFTAHQLQVEGDTTDAAMQVVTGKSRISVPSLRVLLTRQAGSWKGENLTGSQSIFFITKSSAGVEDVEATSEIIGNEDGWMM